jgi:hypothetical protein
LTIDVLNELTDQDFDRLGVSLGHRRRMLRAIRELGASSIAADRQTSASTAPELPLPETDIPRTSRIRERRWFKGIALRKWFKTVK